MTVQLEILTCTLFEDGERLFLFKSYKIYDIIYEHHLLSPITPRHICASTKLIDLTICLLSKEIFHIFFPFAFFIFNDRTVNMIVRPFSETMCTSRPSINFNWVVKMANGINVCVFFFLLLLLPHKAKLKSIALH